MKSQTYIAVFLALLAFASHLPVLDAGFVNFDDTLFITQNPIVQQGITAESIQWAFSLDTTTGWSPLAWVSYLIDYELFGLHPRGYHAVNLLLHTLNVVLLFLLLSQITKQTLPAAIVAAIFAVHPQHVESIAWIAERRDVLFMCFGLLTLLAYHHYIQQPTASRYVLVAFCYALGLMSKPMLVTLPALMLLLDYWPLQRTSQGVRWPRLIAEKIPLLAMACGASLLTVLIQRNIGATMAVDHITMTMRLANTPVGIAQYLWRMVLPINLAFYYPYPLETGMPSPASLVMSVAILISISVLAWRKRLTWPWLITGWLWFLLALLPVCGIVQVGVQRTADRYTYLPLIGIYIAVVWTGLWLQQHKRIAPRPIAIATFALLAVLSAMSWKQTTYWRSSETLCRRAITVTENNPLAHNNLGVALLEHGTRRSAEAALSQFEQAVRIYPSSSLFQRNLGTTLAKLGRIDEAIPHLVEATMIRPHDNPAHYQLALALRMAGDLPGAIRCMEWAVTCDPLETRSQFELGLLYKDVGRFSDARQQFTQTLKMDPQNQAARQHLESIRDKPDVMP